MLRRALLTAASMSIAVATVIAPAAPAGAATTTGKALLGRLTVKPESTRDYDRDKFNRDWLDRNGDCQDTRSEVLQDESSVAVTHWGSTCSAVRTGRWVSWYDDKTWTNATQDLEIDHVVALSEAWDSGAWAWTTARRERYANDLGFAWSLDAVTGSVNQSKSDSDPAEWLPEHHVCKYARHWVAIKYRWKLSINAAEKTKLARILTGDCGALDLTVPKRAT